MELLTPSKPSRQYHDLKTLQDEQHPKASCRSEQAKAPHPTSAATLHLVRKDFTIDNTPTRPTEERNPSLPEQLIHLMKSNKNTRPAKCDGRTAAKRIDPVVPNSHSKVPAIHSHTMQKITLSRTESTHGPHPRKRPNHHLLDVEPTQPFTGDRQDRYEAPHPTRYQARCIWTKKLRHSLRPSSFRSETLERYLGTSKQQTSGTTHLRQTLIPATGTVPSAQT